jgi:exodeoxyribonuclease VII small subunit
MARVTKTESEESYQALREQLDGLLNKLQDPAGDVDEAVDTYEQALTVIKKLEQHLETAENRIKKVQTDFGITTTDT